MLANESSGSGSGSGGGLTFDLPDEVLEVLPSDPFEQLDFARKITSIALSTRVSSLESESSDLRTKIAEKDELIAELQSHVDSLDSALSDKLAQVHLEKENLLKDNANFSNTVKKLQRDVSKISQLEVFRKTLMKSLQEDEDGSAGVPHIIAKPTSNDDDDATLPPSKPSIRSQVSDLGSSFAEEHETEEVSRPGIAQGLTLVSKTTTARMTPPGSPPILSTSVSPTRTSRPVSPRRHSISFATSRGMFDDRSSFNSSLPSSQHSSISSDTGSQTARTRVDGKEFFRQIRSRLPYEQFSAFLANVKELNAHKQTKEETLRKADEIFGPDNRDLYTIFEGLITRNVH